MTRKDDKREAYKMVHVYADKVLHFKHHKGNVTFTGTFTKLSDDTYAPFHVDIEAKIIRDDGADCGRVSRRTRTIEDAVVFLWNGFNENANKKNKYSSLEDILFLD